MPWLFLGEAMKVKTFTGTHTFAVDSRVNNRLARSNVKVRKTQDLCRLQSARREGVGVAAKRRRVGARDRDNGLVRRAVPQPPKSIRPLGFSNQANGFGNNTLGGHLSEWN